MSATISNAYRRSLRGKILAKAQAKVEAKAKATTPARASRKDVVKGKTRVKVKPDRVVRSRGRSGMGSNIAWHRRHNDSVD